MCGYFKLFPQEVLEKNRQEHDGGNQIKEANLDIIMDKMRQDSSEQALRTSLGQALTLLNEIKQLYHDFHTHQVETACAYPTLVQEELNMYDIEVCKYFQVNRNPPMLGIPVVILVEEDWSSVSLVPSPPLLSYHRETNKTNPVSRGKNSAVNSPKRRPPKVTTPVSIDDILTTSNGTTFYILKEPGEHGLPETPESLRSMKTCMTFLTENSENEETTSPYIDAIAIKEELFVELRKLIRMEFLEHLEKWKDQALEHSNSVVSAKMEELNSELDLRLHLHEPRASRAEQDVHNVRAAEVIMHKERVDSHCKGVTTTLGQFKARFHEMVEEHDKETEFFKRSVLELEATFVSATKTHELLAIQDQVANRVEQYMEVIRSSIRKFRHDLDEILSTLRNSNARFRKTFKVFSDGGNFSTDEIEEYRKRLEKMASRIDTSEGSFMAELEGMETKRLEASTDHAGKLEDRFKHHLFDLTYIEKISRWLTNTQVKVKSEVSFSNSQAKKLAVFMTTFDRHIDAVEKPNLDKEQVTAREVQASLIPILQAFHERCVYLNALVSDATPSLNVLKAGLKVGFNDDKKAQLKDAKDTSKHDLKGKKTKRKSKSLIELELKQEEAKPKTSPSSSRLAKATDEEGRPRTVPSEIKTVLKRTSSDLEKRKSSGTRKTSAARRDQGPKFDKKYLVFGEKHDDADHFLAKIKNVLREGMDGLLATADLFYRQKGTLRAPTRPQAIQDNFDVCADILVQRLQSYKTQAKEYHNSCIQELRSQLQKFLTLIVRVPVLAINVVVQEHTKELEESRQRKENEFDEHMKELERRKKLHQSQLRPSLGHPHNREEMEALCESESRRNTEAGDTIRDHANSLANLQVEFGRSFVDKLAHICETIVLQFDAVLTIDDVVVGEVEPKPKSSKRLIREKLAVGDEDKGDVCSLTCLRTPSIKTVKTTHGHLAAMKARNTSYE
ncbi:hypothetical protein QZH41_009552, partial [Actinostola sp. cb2023]